MQSFLIRCPLNIIHAYAYITIGNAKRILCASLLVLFEAKVKYRKYFSNTLFCFHQTTYSSQTDHILNLFWSNHCNLFCFYQTTYAPANRLYCERITAVCFVIIELLIQQPTIYIMKFVLSNYSAVFTAEHKLPRSDGQTYHIVKLNLTSAHWDFSYCYCSTSFWGSLRKNYKI